MGDFIIRIHGTGNHGCNREARKGEKFTGCGKPYCADCLTKEFVEKLRNSGVYTHCATFKHWPAELNAESVPEGEIGNRYSYTERTEVWDDMNSRDSSITRIKGSFHI